MRSLLIVIGIIACNDKPNTAAPPQVLPSASGADAAAPMHEDMVLVPAGHFYSSPLSCSSPVGAVSLDARRGEIRAEPRFWIDRKPVTCEEYDRCAAEQGCPSLDRSFGKQVCEYEEVRVSRDDAERYCQWRHRRLPSFPQWQKAARGEDGRHFPDGDAFDPIHACEHPDRPGVDRDCLHVSPFGMEYRLMNVVQGEWTSSNDCAGNVKLPVVVNEFTQRLDAYVYDADAAAVRCASDTQP